MSDLKKYISKRKESDKDFSLNFDEGYQAFKIGLMLKEARENAGITQEELAVRLSTKKSAISRIENHAEDVKLSTLEKFASSLGKNIEIRIY
ncbi:helix-turn-helix domain-containing protein [methanotrophic endosymbiont of Bathymodiolus puteoserpentis (Logatchev)]|jgi:ribosome-binding protein aMBF1 (putative translation factor)|uniref:helix-turn-helix domain-containing protein n=1 Tax=methanotrophic endosymbiont of Bathymodiolus puteoserpentis (Logatchev) TaxID=343235 RepID=UPI00086E1912|nr:helix-turn-helix transcriptional regulator [methanotrophic endosymbiont of Bathymodiolus puteoserpentis (Logatchev)]SCN46593.1 transcriptional regulator, XRE family [methanotrophic endosymbiont of Bathymodiolus azoricus (Menez Gwen)]SHE23042.1 transcriptional regulator, XRE family [methanotrophic endosymbiont of Bathymodiolus puteoserpentis (Logatchev)]